jgi:hypothetical protein
VDVPVPKFVIDALVITAGLVPVAIIAEIMVTGV